MGFFSKKETKPADKVKEVSDLKGDIIKSAIPDVADLIISVILPNKAGEKLAKIVSGNLSKILKLTPDSDGKVEATQEEIEKAIESEDWDDEKVKALKNAAYWSLSKEVNENSKLCTTYVRKMIVFAEKQEMKLNEAQKDMIRNAVLFNDGSMASDLEECYPGDAEMEKLSNAFSFFEMNCDLNEYDDNCEIYDNCVVFDFSSTIDDPDLRKYARKTSEFEGLAESFVDYLNQLVMFNVDDEINVEEIDNYVMFNKYILV